MIFVVTPSEIGDLDAFVFGVEGVVVDTDAVARRAWRRLFDDVLAGRAPGRFAPFTDADYGRYVAGRAPVEAVTGFLESRGIRLPRGRADDPPSASTVWGLANRESALFVEELDVAPLPVFGSAVAFVRSLRSRGVKTAVVSDDRDARHVLGAAGISGLFDAPLPSTEPPLVGPVCAGHVRCI